MSIPTKYKDREVIGLLEQVTCHGKSKKTQSVQARIDTGAANSSVDQELAKQLSLGPSIGEKRIRNAHGSSIRKLVMMTIVLSGKEITTEFTIADRAHMKYPLLIGRNALKNGYLIDPNKKFKVKK